MDFEPKGHSLFTWRAKSEPIRLVCLNLQPISAIQETIWGFPALLAENYELHGLNLKFIAQAIFLLPS